MEFHALTPYSVYSQSIRWKPLGLKIPNFPFSPSGQHERVGGSLFVGYEHLLGLSGRQAVRRAFGMQAESASLLSSSPAVINTAQREGNCSDAPGLPIFHSFIFFLGPQVQKGINHTLQIIIQNHHWFMKDPLRFYPQPHAQSLSSPLFTDTHFNAHDIQLQGCSFILCDFV